MFFCLSSENGSETCSSWKRTSWEVLLRATGAKLSLCSQGPPAPVTIKGPLCVCTCGVDVRAHVVRGQLQAVGFSWCLHQHPSCAASWNEVRPAPAAPAVLISHAISAARALWGRVFHKLPTSVCCFLPVQRLGFLPFVPCTVLWEGTGWNVGRAQRITANE